MYGTVNDICEQLRHFYRSDELMTLIIWTKEDVRDVLDDTQLTDETADEILQQIDGIKDQHEYGVSLETLQAVLDSIREEERQAREATVPAAALEIALRVAWDFMRLEDAQSGEGAAARLYPDETKALLRVSAALRAQTDE